MTPDKHLTNDALTLLATGNYSQNLRREAIAHFKLCTKCLYEYQEIRSILSTVQAASERGLLASPRKPQQSQPREKSISPWPLVGTILTASVVLIITLLIPKTVPTASASELLDRAITSEHQLGSPVAFAFVSHGIRCGHGRTGSDLVLSSDSTQCQKVRTSMKETVWGTHNPLAASTFQAWHASLSDHHDSVQKLPTVWTIETSTSTGVIRDARFTLRQDTYQPLELFLQFSDAEQVTIKEEPNPLPDDLTANLFPTKVRTSAVNRTNDPADILEVQAWQILRDLNGDTGWEARIVRSGSSVKVEAQVVTAAREQEFENAFKPYPKIVEDIHQYGGPSKLSRFLPSRRSETAGGPPLAHQWLEEQFEDPVARSQFVNGAVKLSKEILGRSYTLEELKERRATISHCSCARTLDHLIADENTSLLAAEKSLGSSLAPLIGPPRQTIAKRIMPETAQRLDAEVLKLLFASPPNDATPLDREEKIVRHLL